MQEKTHYEWLEVMQSASEEVIEMAYKAQIKKYHPDTYGGNDAENIAKKLNSAREVLLDPAKRAEYDNAIETKPNATYEKYTAQTAPTQTPREQILTEQPFLMPISEVFEITGRGIVAVGCIERGTVALDEKVEIVGFMDKPREAFIYGIEMRKELHDYAEAGDNVGLLLKGFTKSDVVQGQVLASPGSIKPTTKFRGQVYHLTKEEGGRLTPLFSGLRLKFAFRTALVVGVITLPDGVSLCNPGDSVEIEVELVSPMAIDADLRFEVHDGGIVVSRGIVTVA